MKVIIEGKAVSSEERYYAMSNCEGQCNSDSGWCNYDPDTNCWDDGD